MASGRSVKAGEAFVELFTKDAKLIKGLRKAQRRVRAFALSIRNVGQIGTAIAGAVAAPLAASTKIFARYGDSLDKMSIRTGIAVDALSELDFAASQTGTSLDDLAKATLRMNRRLGRITAGQGSSEQVKALEALGLSAQRLESLSPEQRLLAIADAMSKMADPAEAAGLAQRAFGQGVDAILPLLLQGRQGIEALRQEARDLGLNIDPAEARAAAQLTDAWDKLFKVGRRAAFAIGAALAPRITDLTDRIRTALRIGLEWVKNNGEIIRTIALVTAGVLAGGIALIGLGTAIGLVGFALGGMATILTTVGAVLGVVMSAVGALLTPIGLVTTAVISAAASILYASGRGGQALDWLGERFGELSRIAQDAWRAIANALAAGDMEAAAQVAWAGLKLVFLQGINELDELWDGMKRRVGNAFSDAFTGTAKIAINAWDGLRAAWVETLAFIERHAISIGGKVASVWRQVVGAVADAMLEAQGVIDPSFDVKAAQDIRRQNTQADQRQADTRRDQQLQQSEQQRQADLARIGRDNLATIAALDAQAEQARTQREAKYDKARTAAEKKLAEARTAWEEAIRDARSAQPDASTRAGGGAKPAFDLDALLAQITAGIETTITTAQRTQTTGTFNAVVADALFGPQAAAERTAKATETTAQTMREVQRNTRDTAKAINDSSLAFA